MPGSRGDKRQDARALRSRAAMRDALLALLAETPLEAITGAMIAERAGVGYATFFRHYADVPDLLGDTVATLTDAVAARMMPAMLAADTGEAAALLVGAIAERRSAFAALLGGAGDALRGQLSRQVVGRVEALPDLSPAWLPFGLAIRIAVASTIEVLEWWLLREPAMDEADVAAMLDRLVIAPLTAPAKG